MSHKAKKKNNNYKGYKTITEEEKKELKKKASRYVELTKVQKALIAAAVLFQVVLLFWMIAVYGSLPALVPTEFQNGEVVATSGKGIAAFLPIGGLIAIFLVMLFDMFPKAWNLPIRIAEENYEEVVFGLMRTLIALMALEVSLVFGIMEIGILAKWMYPAWLIYAAVASLFITLAATVLTAMKYGRRDLEGGGRNRRRSGIGRTL